jgi:hypothetical protein
MRQTANGAADVNTRAQTSSFSPSLVLLAWAAVNVFDALLTFSHLGWGGTEANPLLAGLQSSLGTQAMLCAKVTGALVVGLLLARAGKHRHLLLAAAAMSVVVIYNAALVPAVLAAR